MDGAIGSFIFFQNNGVNHGVRHASGGPQVFVSFNAYEVQVYSILLSVGHGS